jgi:hypothetical protein
MTAPPLLEKEALFVMAPQRGKPPEGYYTATQTRRKLGNISDGMLRTYISKGLVEHFIPPGRKQGFYKRETVDKLARELESQWVGGTDDARTRFRPATLEDIEAISDIDERTFNTSEPRKTYLQWDTETYSRWLQRNPLSFFVLTNATNKVVGFASILPLKKDTLEHLVHDEIGWMDIPNEDIDLYEPGKQLHLYIIALCIDPNVKGALKERYGARMINSMFTFFLNLAKQGVEIETISARNDRDKPDGKRLLLKLGIPQLRSPVAHMHLFSVRVPEAGNALLVKYWDTLTEWKETHKEK